MAVEPGEKSVGVPHRVSLYKIGKPNWQVGMPASAAKKENRASGFRREPDPPKGEEQGGRPHLSGWYLWFYPRFWGI